MQLRETIEQKKNTSVTPCNFGKYPKHDHVTTSICSIVLKYGALIVGYQICAPAVSPDPVIQHPYWLERRSLLS